MYFKNHWEKEGKKKSNPETFQILINILKYYMKMHYIFLAHRYENINKNKKSRNQASENKESKNTLEYFIKKRKKKKI